MAYTNRPAVVSVSHIPGFGSSQAYTFQFSESNGFDNLTVLNVLINTVLVGRQACYTAYVQSSNTLYLVDDGVDAGGPLPATLS